MVLITDALQTMFLGDGHYESGGQQVNVQDGKAQLADGTLERSTVTMNEALGKTVAGGVLLLDAI